jgi:hypothetical protein
MTHFCPKRRGVNNEENRHFHPGRELTVHRLRAPGNTDGH